MSNVGPNADNAGQQQQGQQQTQEGGQQQQQQQTEDNAQNNADNFEEIWHDPTDDAGSQQTQQTPQDQQSGQQQQQAPNADEAFNTYIEGLELTKDVDLNSISEELNQGKTEGLGKAFSAIATKTYRQAMVDMSRVIDQKVNAGIEKAVLQSSNAAQGNQAVRQMNTTLNFTKNPAVAPIANAALAQLIKKGKSVEDAVEGVRTFFQKTSKLSAKELGLQNPPRGRPGNQSFNGAGDIADDGDDDEIDWLETLGV